MRVMPNFDKLDQVFQGNKVIPEESHEEPVSKLTLQEKPIVPQNTQAMMAVSPSAAKLIETINNSLKVGYMGNNSSLNISPYSDRSATPNPSNKQQSFNVHSNRNV